MALSNYEELRQSVIDQSHRGDLDLKINDFILLTETEIRSNPDESLKLNASELITTLTTSTSSRLSPLPTGYLKGRDVKISLDTIQPDLTYVTPGNLVIRSGTGAPCFFTINANQIEFDILPDDEYTVTVKYFGDFANLSSTNATNDVLTKYPNIYLNGCMAQAFAYANDEVLEDRYSSKFLSAIKSANKTENELRFGPDLQLKANWSP